MRLVIALGGNALLRRGEPMELETQRAHVHDAVRALVGLAAEHELLITHGNGPQVGLLALQAHAYRGVRPYSLDVLDAESEGLVGYLIAQALKSALPQREIATLLTQIEVDAADPAFGAPTKPIGPVYDETEGLWLARERGFALARDGDGYRRVVPSPRPKRILELAAIRLLLRNGHIVICAGGGGIPVVVEQDGSLRGVEAVIDKDRSAALLAEGVDADALVLLTDADGVYEGWGTPWARRLGAVTPWTLRAQRFEPGSMAPKVEAACAFVERSGRWAAIGALEQAAAVVAGWAGTRIQAAAKAA